MKQNQFEIEIKTVEEEIIYLNLGAFLCRIILRFKFQIQSSRDRYKYPMKNYISNK